MRTGRIMSASSSEEQLSKRCMGAEGQGSLLLNATPREAAQLIFFSAEGILGAFTPDKQRRLFHRDSNTVSLFNLSHHECFLTTLQLEADHCLRTPFAFSLGCALLRLICTSSVRAAVRAQDDVGAKHIVSQPRPSAIRQLPHRCPPASATFPHRDVFTSTARLGIFSGMEPQSTYLGETNTSGLGSRAEGMVN